MKDFIDKRKVLLQHLLFWVLYFFYPLFKFWGHKDFVFNYTNSIIEIAFLITSVYSIEYFYFKKKKTVTAILTAIVLLIGLICLNCIFFKENCECDPKICYLNKSMVFFFINMFFVGVHALKINFIANQKLKEIEQQKTEYELEILKSQINPHFLFNSLNMIYSSSLSKDNDVSDKILMLSDNLHYVLHESNKKEVTIYQEYIFIKDYIALFEMRFKDKIDLKLEYVSDNDHQPIAPLLLIPFIENALKYTALLKEKTLYFPIKIFLNNKQLVFSIQNPFSEKENATEKNKKSGIGIKNVKKRLELLYPNKYELTISSNNGLFAVELKINVS